MGAPGQDTFSRGDVSCQTHFFPREGGGGGWGGERGSEAPFGGGPFGGGPGLPPALNRALS